MSERLLLIDSDTLTKWIFPPPNPLYPVSARRPVVAYDVVKHEPTLCVAFPAVADLYANMRFLHDATARGGEIEKAHAFAERAEAVLYSWFGERLFVQYATEDIARRWVDVLNGGPVHENANREHAWVAVIARYFAENRREVLLASEEPFIYDAFQSRGLLEDVRILRPGDYASPAE